MIVIKSFSSLKSIFCVAILFTVLPGSVSAQTDIAAPAERSYLDILSSVRSDSNRYSSTYYYAGAPLLLSKGGKMVPATTLAASSLVTYKGSIAVATVPVKPVDMPTVKPDMSQYNMPVKRPAGNFAALATGLNKNIKLAAAPNLTIAAAPIEIKNQLLGNATDDLGAVKMGFSIAPGGLQTMISITLPNDNGGDVSLTDIQGKTLWTAKATGQKFSRILDADEAGVYYLVVKQGKKGIVRQIVKE